MKTLPFLIIAFLLMSFTSIDKGYLIKGTTKNLPQGEVVYLKVLDPHTNTFTAVDSTILKDNRFEFKGTATYPTYALLELSKNVTEIVVLEEGDIHFTYDLNDELATSVVGTKNNNQLSVFHSSIKRIQKEANAYRDTNQDLLTKAITDNDTEILERLSKEFKLYVNQINTVITNQQTSNPTSYTSAVILFQRLDNKNIDPKEAKEHYNKYSEDIKNANIGIGIKKLIAESEVSTLVKIGDKAIDVSGTDPDGKEITLFKSLGKITLLHFWAPWCPACHETLPIVRDLFQEFHEQGLNIFSIALDEDKQGWIDTINKEKLTWYHIANLYEIQLQYGVKNIPTVFVLDQNGTVIDINHLENDVNIIIKERLTK